VTLHPQYTLKWSLFLALIWHSERWGGPRAARISADAPPASLLTAVSPADRCASCRHAPITAVEACACILSLEPQISEP